MDLATVKFGRRRRDRPRRPEPSCPAQRHQPVAARRPRPGVRRVEQEPRGARDDAHRRGARLLRGRRPQGAVAPSWRRIPVQVERVHAPLAPRVQSPIEALPVPSSPGFMARARGRARAGARRAIWSWRMRRRGSAISTPTSASSPAGGGSQRLPRLIGARRAKELMLLGGWLSAAQSLEWGLVNRVAPAGRLEAEVNELATSLAGKSPSGNRTVKTLVDRRRSTGPGQGPRARARSRRRAHALCRCRRGTPGALAEERVPVFRPT